MKIITRHTKIVLNERDVIDAICDYLIGNQIVEEKDSLTVEVFVTKGRYSAEVEAKQP